MKTHDKQFQKAGWNDEYPDPDKMLIRLLWFATFLGAIVLASKYL